ncbi:MAG: large-conductance mechanosensitive channel protein MscL [Caldilineaceae bacterium]|nr:large-conductance mechanosensitive channel protein MscL [Caldilineaceae bacterium]
MFREFREFINRGNVMDLAVAVVMGTAFTAIVNSFVDDIIMPLVGVLMGGVDISTLSVTIGDATIAYGNFLQAIINFLIIAWVMFLMVKAMNEASRRMGLEEEKKPPAPPKPSEEAQLLAEIRDLLKTERPPAPSS